MVRATTLRQCSALGSKPHIRPSQQRPRRRPHRQRFSRPGDQVREGQGRRGGLCGRRECPGRLGDGLVGVVEQDPGPEVLGLADLKVHGGLTR